MEYRFIGKSLKKENVIPVVYNWYGIRVIITGSYYYKGLELCQITPSPIYGDMFPDDFYPSVEKVPKSLLKEWKEPVV